jgi:hypothetical protein
MPVRAQTDRALAAAKFHSILTFNHDGISLNRRREVGAGGIPRSPRTIPERIAHETDDDGQISVAPFEQQQHGGVDALIRRGHLCRCTPRDDFALRARKLDVRPAVLTDAAILLPFKIISPLEFSVILLPLMVISPFFLKVSSALPTTMLSSSSAVNWIFLACSMYSFPTFSRCCPEVVSFRSSVMLVVTDFATLSFTAPPTSTDLLPPLVSVQSAQIV